MRALALAALACAAGASAAAAPAEPFRGVDGGNGERVAARPELLPYNPVANAGAIVTSSDGLARFTVLTDRLIRMEQHGNSSAPGTFEDRSTLAMMNRNLPVPSFTQSVSGGVLTISTAALTLTYSVGQAFSAASLQVVSANASSAFSSWSFGQAFPGNLLGTIRGLDGQVRTPLNCTLNAGVDDNGEFNHCEFGMVSRDGWVAYEDAVNFALDANDWWAPSAPDSRVCTAPIAGTDTTGPVNSANFPQGTTVADTAACCAACLSDPTCVAGYVFDTAADSPNCWPLSSSSGRTPASNRVFAPMKSQSTNADDHDIYFFGHGHDYLGALQDFVLVSGRAAMTPRYTSGIWWSRWYDLGNFDIKKVVADYESRDIPLDVFVIDMDWHKKNDWSGFTFDGHLFPEAADSMGLLKANGLGITLNLHDASGINVWEDKFPALVAALGLPNTTTKVPMNLVNATVAYAVEDIVIGDLIYDKKVDFAWIDWQQGGDQGGMTGGKQNPTIWLNHLRCTDRHRIGDSMRGLVLARWGGLGGHRYQVGFSGDVNELSWNAMSYQPYFSATAANVGHPFWSHDIVGPPSDQELYTRWLQVGAFSGVMRSHDRGGSAGGCANDASFSCWIVEPWNVPQSPGVFNMEANRLALRMREELLPYIYTHHRAAYDTGAGIILPMYYLWPDADQAYAMDGMGNNVQYMFGRNVLVSFVTTPSSPPISVPNPGLAAKSTWLPRGAWYDVQSGVVTSVASDAFMLSKNYSLSEIPMFYAAGSVIPFLPLESMPSLTGLASKQYEYLGFKVVPGGASGAFSLYEDDGVTTAYLTDNAFAYTTGSYVSTAAGLTFTVSTTGTFPAFPASRAYRLQLLNGIPPTSVVVNGVNVPFNRWGAIAAKGKTPAASQWWYAFDVVQGLATVIDVVGLSTVAPAVITVTYAIAPSATAMSGVFGATYHAVLAKGNTDLDRSTPGSNDPTPAALSQLSSVGELLCYQAGMDQAGFAATVANVPGLLAAAIAETAANKSPRAAYALALLRAVA